ncbi:MAG: hypothetical protein MK194_14055 [Roseibacillus sp.]|nr:hypothetical protein [Roseibacillus sp.]
MSQPATDKCHCWIPVLATVLILFSLFDAGFSAVLGVINVELQSLQEQVEQGGTRLKVAGFLSHVTGGIVNLGSSYEAEQVKDILKSMPELGFLAFIAWARVWLAAAGLAMGIALAFRVSWAPLGILIWAGLALLGTGMASVSMLSFYQGLSAEASAANISFIAGLDVVFHLAWPLYLVVRLLRARRAGDYPGW